MRGSMQCMLLAGLLSFAAIARGGEPKLDACQLGQQAMAAGAHEKAIEHFKEFLSSSVGDPRIAAVQAELPKAHAALITRLTAEAREDDAARQYLALAALPGMNDDDHAGKARILLLSAIEKSARPGAAARQLRLAEAFVELFPGEPRPLTEERMADLRLAALQGMLADRLAIEVLPETVGRWYPQNPPWDKIRAGRHQKIAEEYLRALSTRGWHGRLLYELRADRLGPEPMPAVTLRDLHERTLLARLEAWVQFGNAGMVQKTLAEAEAGIKSPAMVSKLAAVRKRVEKPLAAGTEPLPMKFDQPLKAVGAVWADQGRGYRLAGKVEIGAGNDRGEVTARGPFLLEGGRIDINRGKLTLAGTPTAPIIFRNVEIHVSMHGELAATGVIFENCRFHKQHGGWWIGGYTSKWRLNNCLLYRTRFGSLSQVDYGLEINDSVFLECTLPGRILPDQDLAKAYQHSWNRVRGNHFVHCTMPASIVWLNQNGSFINCTITGRNDFASTTSHGVAAYALWPEDFMLQLQRGTRQGGAGKVSCVLSPRPLGPGLPPSFWALLPDDASSAE